MRGLTLLFLFGIALTQAYTITYTSFNGKGCNANQRDNTMSGIILENTCAQEFSRSSRTGKITFMNATMLTSCDYSDTVCGTQTICENYDNDKCYSSTVAPFSNKYSWVSNGNGGWTLVYTAYTQTGCKSSDVDYSGEIFFNKCSAEFVTAPRSGKITAINDTHLISCDYSDASCGTLILCETYANGECNTPDAYISFSDSYSWPISTSPVQPTNAPATFAPITPAPSTTGGDNADSGDHKTSDWKIVYTAYEDNTCNAVDDSMTGEIFAYKCAPEFRKGPQAGRITAMNATMLTSCDYTDTKCENLEICEMYNNGQCYSSSNTDFSNSYTWNPVTNAIIYRSYPVKNCAGTPNVEGQIFFDMCSLEYREKPQSGMITFIDENMLTSCDYSDSDCKNLILCEDYNNSVCYGSAVTSFSNKYSWAHSAESSATTLVSGLVFSAFALAVALF